MKTTQKEAIIKRFEHSLNTWDTRQEVGRSILLAEFGVALDTYAESVKEEERKRLKDCPTCLYGEGVHYAPTSQHKTYDENMKLVTEFFQLKKGQEDKA